MFFLSKMEELINIVNDRMQLNQKQIETIIKTKNIKSIFKPNTPDFVIKIITAECVYHCGAVEIPELGKKKVKCYVPQFIIIKEDVDGDILDREKFWKQFDKYLN